MNIVSDTMSAYVQHRFVTIVSSIVSLVLTGIVSPGSFTIYPFPHIKSTGIRAP
jgi:hypothetical protein